MKKKAKITISLLLSALMLAGTVGMAFGQESADAAVSFAGQEVVVTDVKGAEAGAEAAEEVGADADSEATEDAAEEVGADVDAEAAEDASGFEVVVDAEDGTGAERSGTYTWYRCTAPEYLNVRTNKSTLDSSNIRGHILANTVVWAWDQGDGWHLLNFCGNAYYVSSAFLSAT